MTAITHRKYNSMESPPKMSPGGDLWRYAPVRDAKGQSLSDLLILLPGIKQGKTLTTIIRQQLQDVLEDFGEQILFVDLNLRLGILWITVTSEPGLCGEVAEAIRARIVGARVISSYVQCPRPERLTWMARVKHLLT